MKKVFFISLAFAMLVFSCSSTENELITKPTSKPLKVQSSIGTIYYIAQGGISDHSNASTPYSIAWYFATYGAGNTYILNTPNTYYALNSKLTVPANSIFKGNSTTASEWKLAAGSGLNAGTMLAMKDSSTIQSLCLNATRNASIIVNANSTKNVTIANCTLFETKNNFTTGTSIYTSLIMCSSSDGITIQDCLLRRAGSEPILSTVDVKGYGILAWSIKNATIIRNNIAYTATCGIDITGSSTVFIDTNVISYTGQNRPSLTSGTTVGPIADAITAYHNWNSLDENLTITNNTISYAGNHGIHVSGKVLNIQNNTISNQQLSGIMVDDWRTTSPGNEYSENVIIKNNKCGDPLSWVWQPGNSNRKIFVDRVNNGTGITLDYTSNKNLSGVTLVVNSTNYHLPTLFGAHQ